jgi:hypothetical protein
MNHIEAEALKLAKSWFEANTYGDEAVEVYEAIEQALAAPVQAPVLHEIEQYRMQMAGISTAALGYWKEGDSIHPDYDTTALRDVAKLYAKYAALHAAAQPAVPEGWKLVPEDPTNAMLRAVDRVDFTNADTDGTTINVWNAMLAAAPEKGQP